jgi:type IV secretory pathway VirB3-like protein
MINGILYAVSVLEVSGNAVKHKFCFIGSEVLIIVASKCIVFWVVMQDTLEKDQHFKEIYHLHLEG